MKKLLLPILLILLVACGNQAIIDTTYTFHRAQIKLPNGEVIEGTVDKWSDYEADQLQITIEGTTYLVHSSNAVLIHQKGQD